MATTQTYRDDRLESREQVAHKFLVLARVVGVFLIAAASFRLAWVSDDALITLRSALNITHNWGPGYNATEAVQAYTHPLWFVLWTLIGSVTNQWILGILFASVTLTTISVGIVLWRTPSISRIIFITGVLLFSNAFIEYSTSGLESPLAFLTIAIFGVLAARILERPTWHLAILMGLTGSAVVLTRFDLILFIAPWVVLVIWHLRIEWPLLLSGVGSFLAPLVVWFAWSQLTYSTLLPNTFEAKRNVNIPTTELIVQGFRYFFVSFEHDPVTLVGLILGIGAAFIFGKAFVRAGAIGVVLYLLYVLSIGGDFMAGRFFAVAIFMTMFLLASITAGSPEVSPAAIGTSVLIVVALVVGSSAAGSTPVSLSNPREPRWEVDQNFNAGVSDERGSYVTLGRDLKGFIDNLSLAFVDPVVVPIGDGTALNRPLRNIDRTAKQWPTNDGTFTLPSETSPMCGFLGTVGIVTGPTIHLIDDCALTDRYLAARPFTPAEPFAWKPGHFHREIPEGYVDAVATGDVTRVVDPQDRFELEKLWAKIR